jgi:hypothetical protein
MIIAGFVRDQFKHEIAQAKKWSPIEVIDIICDVEFQRIFFSHFPLENSVMDNF